MLVGTVDVGSICVLAAGWPNVRDPGYTGGLVYCGKEGRG